MSAIPWLYLAITAYVLVGLAAIVFAVALCVAAARADRDLERRRHA